MIREKLSPPIFSYILLIKSFNNYKGFLVDRLNSNSFQDPRGAKLRENNFIGKATCRLYTSSSVITIMMTTMGKKHRPLMMTIIGSRSFRIQVDLHTSRSFR